MYELNKPLASTNYKAKNNVSIWGLDQIFPQFALTHLPKVLNIEFEKYLDLWLSFSITIKLQQTITTCYPEFPLSYIAIIFKISVTLVHKRSL